MQIQPNYYYPYLGFLLKFIRFEQVAVPQVLFKKKTRMRKEKQNEDAPQQIKLWLRKSSHVSHS
jgi:hypothetical protein